MELGSQIRQRRAQLGMSQDELAARAFVSRQTISSWENGKTYPDVQSLLLLSEVFGATVDALVKGDVDAMEKTVREGGKRLLALGWVMVASFVLFLATMGWACWQWFAGWGAKSAPTVVLAALFAGAMVAAALAAERVKRTHDLVTYREILAYTQGEPVNRATDAGSRLRASRPARLRRSLLMLLACLVAGGAAGYGVALLADTLA